MTAVTDRELQLAGVETLDAMGVTHAIMIPPSVEIRPLPSGGMQPEDLALQVVYPVPPNWSAAAAPIDWRVFDQAGWLAVDSTDGLVNAFLALARYDTDEAAVPAVQRFVGDWGPLWFCRNTRHGRLCLWSGSTALYWPEQPCQWVPQEDVALFRLYARRAKAAIIAAHHLCLSERVPRESMQALGAQEAQLNYDIPRQEAFLQQWLNRYLMGPMGVQVRFSWRGNHGPRLTLHSGLGFLRVVWLHIAQLACGVQVFWQCDGCGQLYGRSRRRPQRGRRNFCDACGVQTNYRPSKRLSAREQRRQPRLEADAAAPERPSRKGSH
jgi:hypothetical protein